MAKPWEIVNQVILEGKSYVNISICDG